MTTKKELFDKIQEHKKRLEKQIQENMKKGVYDHVALTNPALDDYLQLLEFEKRTFGK